MNCKNCEANLEKDEIKIKHCSSCSFCWDKKQAIEEYS
jgi:hypothetical protein